MIERSDINKRGDGTSLRLGQRVLVVVFALLVCLLGTVVYGNVNGSVEEFKLIGNTGSTTSNIVIMQRESLMYSLEVERWLAQTSTRRDVQIRRALLAQRLQARDSTGVANGERTHPEYFETLRQLDAAVDTSPAGFLPSALSSKLRVSLRGNLDQFTFEARELVGRISRAGDEQTKEIISAENDRRSFQGLVVLIILLVISLVSIYLATSRLKDFKVMRRGIADERAVLASTRGELNRVEHALSERIEEQKIDENQAKHLDASIRELNKKFRMDREASLVVGDLAKGLGDALKAEAVLFYSFNKILAPNYLLSGEAPETKHLDGSMLTRLESGVVQLVTDLWTKGAVDVMDDTANIQPDNTTLPLLLRESAKRVRSWLIVPMGEGSNVLGYISLAMVSGPRKWTLREIAMVQAVVANAATALVHRYALAQNVQIAEHEAVVKRLLELDKAKDDFIANVNHELRTPLTSIIGYVEMALEDASLESNPNLEKSLQTIERNAFRLQTLIEDMLELARLEANFLPATLEPVDIVNLVESVAKLLAPFSTGSGVEVAVTHRGRCFEVMGDSGQIEQVLTNLMSNAVKFTPKRGLVSIEVSETEKAVQITVADTGVGIPAGEIDSVFERFFRASTATEALIPGTGLGLSIVKQIVEGHGGTITFVSEVGVGTTFTVTLPRHQEPAPIVAEDVVGSRKA